MGPSSSGTDPSCDYIDLEILIVACGNPDAGTGSFKYLRRWVDSTDFTCDPYFTIGTETHFPTQEAALSSESCSAECLWRAATSASFVHCEQRNGYIVYTDEGCPDIYEYSDGLYGSHDEWVRNHPCN